MAVRRVELRITSTGFDTLSKNLDELSAKLDKLKVKLDALSKKVISPKMEIAGLASSDADLDKFSAKLDKIGTKRVTAHVGVNVDSGALRRDIGKVGGKGGSAIDRLLKDATGGGKGDLFSNAVTAGSGGSSTGAGLLSALGGANNSYFGALIAALIGVGAAITPAILPFAIGGGVGLGGAVGAGALGKIGKTTITADRLALAQAQAALRGSRGRTPSNLLALSTAQRALSRAQTKYGGFLPVGNQISNLGNTAIGDFLSALSGHGTKVTATSQQAGGPGSQQVQGGIGDILKVTQTPSFLQGLSAILKQVGAFLKAIGPQLGDMFRASIPFVAAFAKIMEQLAKALLPSFTQSMKELTPFLPIIIQGFKFLSLGIAQFIKNLGPGMKDSAIIFKGVMDGIKGVLDFLGTLFAGFAIEIVKISEGFKVFATVVRAAFDEDRHAVAVIWKAMWDDTVVLLLHSVNKIAGDLTNWRHDVSDTFAGIRHDIAHWWDLAWNDTVSFFLSASRRIMGDVTNWRHDIANAFTGLGHDAEHIWDTMWSSIINAAVRFGHTVESDFNSVVRSIHTIIDHLPGQLYQIGKTALEELWNGAKSQVSKVEGLFQGVGHEVLHLFDVAIGRHSPSSEMFARGVDLMRGLENGIQSRMPTVKGLSGHVGGNVVSWIEAALKATHSPMSWLPALEVLVSKESGGNPGIVDPIAVGSEHATGLFQTLPSTFAAYSLGGSITNPIADAIAGIRYIKSRYGAPQNIPGLLSGHYEGYAKGGWIREPVMGIGMRSGTTYGIGENGPEFVSPAGSGGNVYITVAGDTNPDAAALRISTLLQRYSHRHGGQQPWNR